MNSVMNDTEGAQAEFQLASVETYEPLIGGAAVERILAKARLLRDLHLVNVTSTYYGGGVAELLSLLALLLNAAGIRTGWRVIQGRPDFFSVTSELKRHIYEEVVNENAVRMHLDHDLVIVHDPQPLSLIQHCRKKAPWMWRCHVDLGRPDPTLWSYLARFIERYDAVVVSLPDYAQKLDPPQRFIMPAINPFSTTNKDLSEAEIDERLAHYDIPADLPLVVQKSLREGFGLTVAEAMWKGAAVVGGNVGGIRHQIDDGVNGFLVDGVEQAAARIVQLLQDPDLRRRLGAAAKESVRQRFLMTRLMEDWLDLIGAFEASFKLRAYGHPS